MPERQRGEVPEAAVEASGRALAAMEREHNARPIPPRAMVALPFRVDAMAQAALDAACDPALGDQRLVPLAAVLDVLRDYELESVTEELPSQRLARTFGGEPDER